MLHFLNIYFHESAIAMGKRVRGSNIFIDQRHFTEEIAGLNNCERFFTHSGNHFGVFFRDADRKNVNELFIGEIPE
jgi:hypothetical protein